MPRPGFWPASVHMCSYWWGGRCTAVDNAQLPPAVLQLLGSGQGEEQPAGTAHCPAGLVAVTGNNAAAPVCVDFGSMPLLGLLPNPTLLAAVLLAAARRLRRPVLLLTAGWQPLVEACRRLQQQGRQQQSQQEQQEQPSSQKQQEQPSSQKQQEWQQPQQPQQQQEWQQPQQPQQQPPDPPWLVPLELPVPHDWLLPRCAALLHHGGAGTVAAALRCGTPQLVCPLHFDQQQWAERVVWLGCGTRLEPAALLQADEQQGDCSCDAAGIPSGQQQQQQQQRVEQAGRELAAAVASALEDAGTRQQCASMRQQLAEEDGLAAAVQLVQQHLDSWRQEYRRQEARHQVQQARQQSDQQQGEQPHQRNAAAAQLELPGGLRVRCLPGSEGEVLFIHRELFLDDCYLSAGITLPPGSVVVDAGVGPRQTPGSGANRAARRLPAAAVIAACTVQVESSPWPITRTPCTLWPPLPLQAPTSASSACASCWTHGWLPMWRLCMLSSRCPPQQRCCRPIWRRMGWRTRWA